MSGSKDEPALLHKPLHSLSIQPLPANLATTADDSLHAALLAVAEGRDLAPHMGKLRAHYGGGVMSHLAAGLEKTVSQHPEVLQSQQEWIQVVQHHPQLAMVAPPHFLTDDFYIELCVRHETFAWLPANMPEPRRQSVCTRACLADVYCRTFAQLPQEYKTAELCAEVCATNPEMLKHVPDACRTPELCRMVCEQDPLLFTLLTVEQKTPYLACLACAMNGEVLTCVPDAMVRDHPNLYEIACTSNGMALQYIPVGKRTPELCRLAVASSAKALTLVPEDLHNEDLYRWACRHSGAALQYIDSGHHTEKLFQLALHADHNGHLAFPYVPAKMITQTLCEQLAHKDPSSIPHMPDHINCGPIYNRIIDAWDTGALRYIPAAQRSYPLCTKALKASTAETLKISDIPVKCWSFELFVLALQRGRWNAALAERAKKLLPCDEYQLLLTLCAVQNSAVQLQMLSSPSLSSSDKTMLANFLSCDQVSCLPERPPVFEALESRKMPLQWLMLNRTAYPLLQACYRHPGYEPPQRQAGRAVEEYIAAQLRTFHTCLRLPSCQQPDLRRRGQLKGGRTLKVDEGESAVYYKFQKEGEPLTTLVREGLVHRYRKEHPDSPMARLVSDLPRDPQFFELDQQNWPADLDEWPDMPQKLSRSNGRRYINVYRYRASADYSRYAHQPDSSSIDPWQKPEAGILAACHDMGLFAAHGLPLTSMLPAFHDSGSGRAWLVLHSLLGYRPFAALPGTFGAWNTEATAFCDIGHSGLRDVGDFEPFGAIDSLFDKKDTLQSVQPLPIRQKLAFINTVCENLLAAVLIRARLRQQSPDYHVDNSTALDETITFIGDACRQFLIGMGAPKESGELLRDVLKVDRGDLAVWLDRSAREILYWTAAQPAYNSPNTPAFAKDDRPWDHADCYALHLRRTGKLCPKLYSHDQPPISKCYPEDFHNKDNRLNLGANNTVFPLISLIKGFIQLGTGLLSRSELFEGQNIERQDCSARVL